MRLELHDPSAGSRRYAVKDPDHPDYPLDGSVIGYGNSPDEAIGHAVREQYLTGNSITVDDISSYDGAVNEDRSKAPVGQPVRVSDAAIYYHVETDNGQILDNRQLSEEQAIRVAWHHLDRHPATSREDASKRVKSFMTLAQSGRRFRFNGANYTYLRICGWLSDRVELLDESNHCLVTRSIGTFVEHPEMFAILYNVSDLQGYDAEYVP